MKFLKSLAFLSCCLLLGYSFGGLYAKLSGLSDHSIESRVVQLTSKAGSCSGEQVKAPSGQSYILTAAHCKVLESKDGTYTVTNSHGDVIIRKFIEEDDTSDLILIEGLPGVEGLEIAHSAYAKQAIRTFTHGHGFATYKTEGVLVQDYQVEIALGIADDPANCAKAKYKIVNVDFLGLSVPLCILSVEETVTTAFISPGSSGGPVVDEKGALVGVVSAGGQGFGFLVKLQDIQAFLAGY